MRGNGGRRGNSHGAPEGGSTPSPEAGRADRTSSTGAHTRQRCALSRAINTSEAIASNLLGTEAWQDRGARATVRLRAAAYSPPECAPHARLALKMLEHEPQSTIICALQFHGLGPAANTVRRAER